MLNATKATGCAWTAARMSGRTSYTAWWKGNSDEADEGPRLPRPANADNIIACQAAFVDPGRRDPDAPVRFANRKVAARSRGHAVPIDAFHRAHDLVARVGHLPAHTHHHVRLCQDFQGENGSGNQVVGFLTRAL